MEQVDCAYLCRHKQVLERLQALYFLVEIWARKSEEEKKLELLEKRVGRK